jgi:hypothetical protein
MALRDNGQVVILDCGHTTVRPKKSSDPLIIMPGRAMSVYCPKCKKRRQIQKGRSK